MGLYLFLGSSGVSGDPDSGMTTQDENSQGPPCPLVRVPGLCLCGSAQLVSIRKGVPHAHVTLIRVLCCLNPNHRRLLWVITTAHSRSCPHTNTSSRSGNNPRHRRNHHGQRRGCLSADTHGHAGSSAHPDTDAQANGNASPYTYTRPYPAPHTVPGAGPNSYSGPGTHTNLNSNSHPSPHTDPIADSCPRTYACSHTHADTGARRLVRKHPGPGAPILCALVLAPQQ